MEWISQVMQSQAERPCSILGGVIAMLSWIAPTKTCLYSYATLVINMLANSEYMKTTSYVEALELA
jgi:hypothetical protein